MSEEVKQKVLKDMLDTWARGEAYSFTAEHVLDLSVEELQDLIFTIKDKAKAINGGAKLKSFSNEEVGKIIKALGESNK